MDSIATMFDSVKHVVHETAKLAQLGSDIASKYQQVTKRPGATLQITSGR